MRDEEFIRPQTALITGASRGLGAALALALGQEGLAVALVARGADELTRTVQRLRDAGVRAHGIVADVADKDATHRIAALAALALGPVDLLVHNASTLGPVPMPLVIDTECEDLGLVFETNVTGPFRLTKVIAGSMALRGRGQIVVVSSDAATTAYANWGAYGASKAAADHLHHVLAVELQDTQVRVLAVDPGEMDTAMHRAAMPEADPGALASPDTVARRLAGVLLRGQQVPYRRLSLGEAA
jgi:NAD(P)-dependent dehydrogenase (short-subunit alcohol dehydrogenase family)